jgi:ElaA protein
MPIQWDLKSFDELTAPELYAILQLRNEVFVVEQKCVYQDTDGKDPFALHLCGRVEHKLVAYTRILPPGISFTEASIGRVVISPSRRGEGTGRLLMKESIRIAFNRFTCTRLKIGAQIYLVKFYTSLGFLPCSDPYLEDGIPHIGMILHK